MTRRAIVSGGSIGGLFAAAALRKRGWQVDVLERTEVELSGRGAGIVTHDVLVDALVEVGASTDKLGVEVEERVAFDIEGNRVAAIEFPQVVTSWDRIHRLLRDITPDDTHHLGKQVVGYDEMPDHVEVRLSNGEVLKADLLVGADGFRSAVRAQFLPDVQPIYSGYVVWRALAHEIELPQHLRERIFPAFGFFAPAGTQIIGYPIAGPKNDLFPGRRRYNFVWYTQVPQSSLKDMLTDANGTVHDVSIPPPLIRDEVLGQMHKEAERLLPKPFVEILDYSERPFFTPIYDHLSPIFGKGRVALSGDAACVARPHVGMGVTKAACDALALARHLDEAPDIPAALDAYSAERVPAAKKAMEQARRLGSYIFDMKSGATRDGRVNPRLDEVMRNTAVTVA